MFLFLGKITKGIQIKSIIDSILVDTFDIRFSSSYKFLKGFDDLMQKQYKEFHTVENYANQLNVSPKGLLKTLYQLNAAKPSRIIGSKLLFEAKKLLAQCEEWAKNKGCTEFASDCESDNDESLKFHINMGFTEVNRIICFKKQL